MVSQWIANPSYLNKVVHVRIVYPPPVMLVTRVSSTIGGPGGVKPPIITA